MPNFIIKYILILSLSIIINSCTDMLTNDENYKSLHLKGGAWIEFQSADVQDYLNSSFTLQMWVSGNSNSSNDAKTLLSIIDDNDNSIIFGLFRDTSVDNALDVYFNNELIETISDDNLNWSTGSFDLVTVTSESLNDGTDNHTIKIFINDSEVFSSDPINLNVGDNNLIIGGRVNTSQTYASNFWTGCIDEIRLWNDNLTAEEITFHINNPTKLNSSSGCSDNQYTNLTSCEEAGEVWSGIYSDQRLENLVGLWRFNYNSPQYHIKDESCRELNLDSGVSDNGECLDIDGTIYTLPGYSVQFSRLGI